MEVLSAAMARGAGGPSPGTSSATDGAQWPPSPGLPRPRQARQHPWALQNFHTPWKLAGTNAGLPPVRFHGSSTAGPRARRACAPLSAAHSAPNSSRRHTEVSGASSPSSGSRNRWRARGRVSSHARWVRLKHSSASTSRQSVEIAFLRPGKTKPPAGVPNPFGMDTPTGGVCLFSA